MDIALQTQLLGQMGIGPVWKLNKTPETIEPPHTDSAVCHRCGRDQQQMLANYSDKYTDKTCLFVVPDTTDSIPAQKLLGNMLIAMQKVMPAYKIPLASGGNLIHHDSLCRECLKRLMVAMPAAVIIGFGVACASELLEDKEMPKLEQLRQKLHDFSAVPMLISYSLEYLLRQPKMKYYAWEDLCLAMKTIR